MTALPAPNREPFGLLTAAQVAALFRVDVKTVRRWAHAGWLSSYRAGGVMTFREAEVRALLTASTT